MSGGGIWAMPVEPRDGDHIWSAGRAVLIGIQTGVVEKEGLLTGNRIQVWVNRFTQRFPELAPFFDLS